MSFSYDDMDKNYRLTRAAQGTSQQVGGWMTAYDAAAQIAAPKPGFGNYAADVMAPILNDGRVVTFLRQSDGQHSTVPGWALGWLGAGSNAGWIHCFTANVPAPSRYRTYVCADLSQTGTLLGFLLAGYPAVLPFKFKVAAHDEARNRNDTIVSWHATLADARVWINAVRNQQALMLGQAPPSSFGGLGNPSIGIDEEIPGSTSTMKTADLAMKMVDKRNPYI